MTIKLAIVSLCMALFSLGAAGPLFADEAAKGVVTKVGQGTITVKDKHGRLTTVHIKPGDFIAIKVR